MRRKQSVPTAIITMTSPLLLLIIICFTAQLCVAQSDTGYYYSNWKKTTAADATHFCTFKQEGDRYAVQCYYLKNGIQSLGGQSTEKDTLKLDGHVDFFNEKGIKDIDGLFQQNVRAGTWTYYKDSTGKKWYTESYNNGKIVELYSYYESGKLKRHEIHDTTDEKNVTGKCYDEDGKEIRFTTFEKMPAHAYDIQQYLSHNMHYPRKARNNGISGRVVVKFVINETGHVANVELLNHIDPELDAEAERVVSEMPRWTPGIQDDKNVKVYFTLPITFKLE